MPQAKEGEVTKCTICEKEIKEDVFWTISRYEKQVPIFNCPTCNKPIRIEFDTARDSFKIEKPCTCTVSLSSQVLEPSPPRWKRTTYVYCDKCFKEAYGNVMFAHLGEEESD